jgi:hypothetical protein
MGVSTIGLGPPTLFLSLLVTPKMVIVRIGRAVLNQSVTTPIAATITIVAMDMFMTERSEFGTLHISPNRYGSYSACLLPAAGHPATHYRGTAA